MKGFFTMKKLTQKIDAFLFNLQYGVKNFVNDERGVSPIIATVLTILIAVLLAVIFWDYIKTWIDAIWAKITAGSNKIA